MCDTKSRRISRLNSGSANCAYNSLGDRIIQSVGITTTNYTLDIAAGLTQVLADGENTYLYGTGRIAQQGAAGRQYFLGDALGSVRQLADSTGEITLVQNYQPYGKVAFTSGGGSSSYGFTAEMADITGLIYLRARYYAPSQGRFLTRDIWQGDLTRPLSLNGWNYVEGNPANFTDPTGLWACRGNPNCKMWVRNSLAILRLSGPTGQRLVDFFNQCDRQISARNVVRNFYPCYGTTYALQPTPGLIIDFVGTVRPGNEFTDGSALFPTRLQLKNASHIIFSPNPTGYGVVVFGHEISHYAQGVHRITVQGEILARFVEQQLRGDLRSSYGDISYGVETTASMVRFNPFSTSGLRDAQVWMIANLGPDQAWLPLTMWGFMLQPEWLKRFAVHVQIPLPPIPPAVPPPTPPGSPPGTPTP
jgi:RHS repeat-associated protein